MCSPGATDSVAVQRGTQTAPRQCVTPAASTAARPWSPPARYTVPPTMAGDEYEPTTLHNGAQIAPAQPLTPAASNAATDVAPATYTRPQATVGDASQPGANAVLT